MPTIEHEGKGFAAAQAAVTEKLVEQLKYWRDQLSSAPPPSEPVEEADRLFAAQMATRLLELSLRPAAVHDLNEVRKLVRPFGAGKFVTNIELDDFTKMIAEMGAIFRGHFVLLSEMHSDYFFMFSRLAIRVEFKKKLASELAKRFSSEKIDSVIAPVTAGGLLVQEVASELKASFAFYDVDDHSRPCAIRRGYSVRGRTLILNDMTTTGEGVEKMMKILREAGVEPVGIGLIAIRGTTGIEIVDKLVKDKYKVEALFHLDIEAVKKDKCEKCRLGLPFISSADINR
jgi:orotate phosphoribosyltransferase